MITPWADSWGDAWGNSWGFTVGIQDAWSGAWAGAWGDSWGHVFSPIPPVAAFVAAPLSGAAPLTVSFTDQSTGSPTAWLWDFGDGSSSAAQNPQHVYASVGSWTVSLTVSNGGGSDTLTRPAYVTTTSPVPPGPPSGNFGGGAGGALIRTKTSRMERDEFPKVSLPGDGEDVAVPLALVLLLAEVP